jgi:hypothetical protein
VPDPADLEVSWRKMPARFLHDEKEMWLFPVQLGKGKHWMPTAIVVGGTAAFIAADPPLMRKVRQTDIFHDYNHVLKSSVSGGLIAVVPLGFYAVSLIRHDSYGQGTALLAGEAVANDTILMIALKAVTRRARPSDTLATAISFSRVTNGSHFPSDVFIGAATGFAIARFDVLRH